MDNNLIIMDNIKTAFLIRRNVFYFFVILAFSSFIYLFSSCELEEDIADNRREVAVPANGELVTVNFTVGERDHANFDVAVRVAQPLSDSQPPFADSPYKAEENGGIYILVENAVVSVAEDLYMSATLQESSPAVRLRAASLEPGRKARVVAYQIVSNDTIKLAHADYEVDAGYNLVPFGTPPMTVSAGSVLFVAYSFNDVGAMPAFAETTAAIGSHDLLWGDTTVTVGPGQTSVHIILDHLFSKIKLEAEADIPAPAPSLINAILGARYDHTFPTLTVHSGDLTLTAIDTIPFDWQASGSGRIWPSKDHFVYTHGNPPVVRINSVTIDGTPYTAPPSGWPVNYTTPLAAGREYTLYVRFTPQCIAATGISIASSLSSVVVGNTVTLTATGLTPSGATYINYIWEVYTPAGWMTIDTTFVNTCPAPVLNVGSNQFRVTATNSCTLTPPSATTTVTGTPLIPSPVGGSAARITWEPPSATYPAGRYIITYDPRDAGLFFGFGSVIGMYSDIGSRNSDLTPPLVATVSTSFDPAVDLPWNLTGVTGTGSTGWGNVPYVSTLTTVDAAYHTLANVRAGRGDPCRLVGLNLADIANPSNPNPVIDNGIWRLPAVAENQNFTGQTGLISFTQHWWDANQPGNISYGVAGGEFPQRGSGGPLKFLPASGVRIATQIHSRGLNGYYWSGVSQNASIGNNLFFVSTDLNPNNSVNKYGSAFPVRCVYEVPTLIVSPGTLTFNSTANGGGPQSVTVTTNQPSWTVTSNQTWATVPSGAQTGTSFNVTIAGANTTAAARTAIITIAVPGGIAPARTVTVTQQSAPLQFSFTSISPANNSVIAYNANTTVTVTASTNNVWNIQATASGIATQSAAQTTVQGGPPAAQTLSVTIPTGAILWGDRTVTITTRSGNATAGQGTVENTSTLTQRGYHVASMTAPSPIAWNAGNAAVTLTGYWPAGNMQVRAVVGSTVVGGPVTVSSAAIGSSPTAPGTTGSVNIGIPNNVEVNARNVQFQYSHPTNATWTNIPGGTRTQNGYALYNAGGMWVSGEVYGAELYQLLSGTIPSACHPGGRLPQSQAEINQMVNNGALNIYGNGVIFNNGQHVEANALLTYRGAFTFDGGPNAFMMWYITVDNRTWRTVPIQGVIIGGANLQVPYRCIYYQ